MYKCHNYTLCRNTLELDNPSPLCTCCRLLFPDGQLTFHEHVNCPVCTEYTRGVCQPHCEHALCIGCFQHCYFNFTHHEPTFPYPEMEEEYYDDPFHQRWDTHYPFIYDYLVKWLEWDNALEESENTRDKDFLRKCPLCRQ